MNTNELKSRLDAAYHTMDASAFIENDPISIPHRFSEKKDIETAGFLTALLSFGRRDMIIRSANKMIQLMDNQPYQFITEFEDHDLKLFDRFVYRTINAEDMKFFIRGLRMVYEKYDNLELAFLNEASLTHGISNFRSTMLLATHDLKSEKHISNPAKNSACKRIFMFLRWMVRKDEHGIDFGIWNRISASDLIIPLDVHTGNSSRALGLTKRKSNDLKTALEITEALKRLDPKDPVKYDYSLFNLDL